MDETTARATEYREWTKAIEQVRHFRTIGMTVGGIARYAKHTEAYYDRQAATLQSTHAIVDTASVIRSGVWEWVKDEARGLAATYRRKPEGINLLLEAIIDEANRERG